MMGALFSSDKTPTEVEKSVIKDWSKLPLPALEKIYSYLCHADQVNMSLVCHNWSEKYGSPSLWKHFRFQLSKRQLRMEICPQVKFALKYGDMFRHVEIHCHYTSDSYAACNHLIAFLQHLTTNSQLTSIKFRGYIWCGSHVNDSTRENVNKAIADFLGSQHHLKKLEFNYWFCNFGQCMELLKNLNEDSRNSIEHFGLGGLVFCESLNAEEKNSDVAQSLLTLAGLPRLTRAFEICYSLIFEYKFARKSAAFKTLRNPQRLVFSKIIIDHTSSHFNLEGYDGLKSFNWRFLTKLYPDLQVELIIRNESPSLQEVESLIVKDMPITRLEYLYEDPSDNSSVMEIRELFDHLLACQTNEHLVSLNLIWPEPIPNFASTFIRFLQACKKLKRLDLVYTIPPVNDLPLLLESWLENRPESLKEVLILIDATDEEYDGMIWMDSITKYVSRLESVGLNVKIDHF